MNSEPGYTCRNCRGLIPEGDKFCPHCGKELTDFDRQIGAALERGDHDGANREVRRAVKWMIALGIMFIVFGTIYGFMNKGEVDQALSALSWYPADMVFPQPIEGQTYTVGELRSQIKFELYAMFGLNYLMALFMFGLSFWARRSPFPAMITALCLYLALIALNAIAEPATLVQGLLIKFLFIGAMIAGIKAALKARDMAAEPSP